MVIPVEISLSEAGFTAKNMIYEVMRFFSRQFLPGLERVILSSYGREVCFMEMIKWWR
jgi:hypothetical protein